MKLVALLARTSPLASIVIWNGAMFPPRTPNSIRESSDRAGAADAPHMASAAMLTTSTTNLRTPER